MTKILPTAGRQISNQIQNQNVKNFLILNFDIPLTFACLPDRQGI